MCPQIMRHSEKLWNLIQEIGIKTDGQELCTITFPHRGLTVVSFTDPEDSVATAVARRCHHNTTGQPHPDGAFAASASSRSTNGAGPTNAAVANAFYIVVWASGGGHVPFWMSSGGHFHQCTGQIVGYDWKSHVPCSHSFQSISVSTLLPPPLFSCSIYNDSPSPWWGAM
ncbi:uncharacterized protein LOC124556658 [Schistocerca americana]|uniref:uncharacterized protein LOC124556658 n=1 Tax=Schistocerca americana TaxID=7009 RepID=UPI001F4F6A4A|nr:uncharacterized protein LOC124556658 [Schistocerca americana]